MAPAVQQSQHSAPPILCSSSLATSVGNYPLHKLLGSVVALGLGVQAPLGLVRELYTVRIPQSSLGPMCLWFTLYFVELGATMVTWVDADLRGAEVAVIAMLGDSGTLSGAVYKPEAETVPHLTL